MSRLVDVNKLKEAIIKEYLRGKKTLMEVIDEQPTAFDVDKVVEQLEELRELDACGFDNCPVEDIYCCDCTQKRMAERAIEIVKGGGVDAKTDS